MTIVCKTIAAWKDLSQKFQNKTIGFVPTMGNLHAGHASLCLKSKQENDITVVSVFVNPTQFNDKQDFANYPHTFAEDVQLLTSNEIDVAFAPMAAEIYCDDFKFKVIETDLSHTLEGKYRPGHFDGVLTVVMKLLQIIKPNKAYFGEKDYQQLQLINQMVKAFFLDVEIIACPTIRNCDGLALSSRNNLLNAKQQRYAAKFYELLSSNMPIAQIKFQLQQHGFKVDYVVEEGNRILGAIWLDGVRLIDNIQKSCNFRLDAT